MPLLDGTYVFRRQHSPGLGFDDKGPVLNSIYALPPGRILTRHSGGRAKDKVLVHNPTSCIQQDGATDAIP